MKTVQKLFLVNRPDFDCCPYLNIFRMVEHFIRWSFGMVNSLMDWIVLSKIYVQQKPQIVTLFRISVYKCNQVRWGHTGLGQDLSSVTNVSVDTQRFRHTYGRRLCEIGGRDCSDAAIRQECQRLLWRQQKPGRGKRYFLKHSEGARPCQYPDFWLLVSGTMSKFLLF
jgi:hypothetical protein